jgi:hypothetical protein
VNILTNVLDLVKALPAKDEGYHEECLIHKRTNASALYLRHHPHCTGVVDNHQSANKLSLAFCRNPAQHCFPLDNSAQIVNNR